MNIFVLDRNPYRAASYQCDKHVVKMIVETSQLLSTALYRSQNIFKKKSITSEVQDYLFENFPRKDKYGNTKPYGIGYVNHPCSVWVSENRSNFIWTIQLLDGLCQQYSFIYGKEHFCQKMIDFYFTKCSLFKESQLTRFKLCMPDIYKEEDEVKSYQSFYRFEKPKTMKLIYKNREVPYFLK